MPYSFKKIITDTLHVLYPHLCMGCGSEILMRQELLCHECMHTLPYTGFETLAENPVAKMFAGRLNMDHAAAIFYFEKQMALQRLLHLLKYKGSKDAGILLGRLCGSRLPETGFANAEGLIPVPLYPKKEAQRGYNQSEVICNGISEITGIPAQTDLVLRIKETESQTRKHRVERWQNMLDGFAATGSEDLQGRHFILVDDVVTTGATMESCAHVLMNAYKMRLSVLAVATGHT